MNKFPKFLLLVVLCATLSSLVMAQTQTGTIRGVVTDEEGNVMPGATVMINSPQMMAKDVSMATGVKGGFRFPALVPGDYELTCSLPGFKTVTRPGIILSMKQTVTINLTLEQSTLEEEITIIASTPTVDLKATIVGQSFKVDYLNQMPNARDLWTVIQEAPGMVMDRYNVGGSESGQQSGFSAHGASDYQTTYNIDGVNTTDMAALGASSTYYSYDAFEEVQISMSSHSAETGPPGVSLNIITKSGSNEFHGDAGTYYSYGLNDVGETGGLSFMQANNITPELEEQGVTHGNPMQYYWDWSANFGGPIIKDKVWFWGLRSQQKIHRFIEGFEFEGKPFPEFTDLSNWMGKLDWQITNRHKIAGSWIYDLKDKPVRNAGRYTPPESAWKQFSNKNIFQLHWTSLLSDSAFLDLRVGSMDMNFPLQPTEQADSSTWPVYEYRTVGPGTKYPDAPYMRGYHNSYYRYMMYLRNRYQASGFLDYYVDDFLGGSHEWKIGFQISKFWSDTARENFGPRLGFRYGKPYNVRVVNTPLLNLYNLMNYAFYIQDSWVLFNRLTINIGVRYETFETYLPEQNNPQAAYPMDYFGMLWENTRPGIWDSFKERSFPEVRDITNFGNFSPRIGLVYDVLGDGKTAFKASFSRYYWQVSNSIANFANPNGRAYSYWRWDDDNGDGWWQEGEERSAPYSWNVYAATEINPDLKNTYTDEITIGFEHEVLKNFSIGITGIFRWDGNIIDDIDKSHNYNDWYKREFVDAGMDNIEGTADDGTFIGWDVDPSKRPRSMWYVTNPELDALYLWEVKNNNYRGLVIRAHKRFSDKWQLLASFTWSRHRGMLSSLEYASGIFDTPNADYLAYGVTYWDRPIILKISGSYQLPLGINMGGSLRYNSGSPWARDAEAKLNYTGSWHDIQVEPRGSQRYDSVLLVDFRAEKFFRIPGSGFFPGGRVGFVFDVFNLFNDNTPTSIGQLTGDTLGIVNKIIAPRVFRAGVRFSF